MGRAILRENTQDCVSVYHVNATKLIDAVHGRKFTPPAGGWNADTFSKEGATLIILLTRVAKITQRKAVPIIADAFVRLIHFQFAEVKTRVYHRLGRSRATGGRFKAEIEVTLPGDGQVWLHALREVFAEQGDNAVKIIGPEVQSTMAQGYSRTSVILGQPNDPAANAGISRRAQETARGLIKLDETTEQAWTRTVEQSLKDGDTVAETALHLEERVQAMARSRSMTVARTEAMKAFTHGSIQAFKESKTLSHCSVIGCESRELERWTQPSYQQFMFRGESTCNIQDVAVADLDKLNFHPNHTGVLVPSKFL